MNPQDDPEARIRDLERPMADRAQTSELGTTPYPTAEYPSGNYAPPPPPPPGYAQPYGMPPHTPATPSKTGWFAFAGLVVALVVAGSAALIYFAMRPADGVSGNPTVAGGGGPLDDVPSAPAIPGLPSGIPNVPGLPGSEETIDAPPGAQVTVSGVESKKTITCNDSTISISGVANVVTITGHCMSVTVSGMNNQITVDETDSVGASGFDNRIVYKSGSPRIEYTSDSNVIQQG